MFRELSLAYFLAFERQDLSYLRLLFAPNVYLRDWNVEVLGLENVLAQYSIILQSLNNPRLSVLQIYESGYVVIAELIISADNLESLRVVDIILFDNNNKIKSIKAFRG